MDNNIFTTAAAAAPSSSILHLSAQGNRDCSRQKRSLTLIIMRELEMDIEMLSKRKGSQNAANNADHSFNESLENFSCNSSAPHESLHSLSSSSPTKNRHNSPKRSTRTGGKKQKRPVVGRASSQGNRAPTVWKDQGFKLARRSMPKHNHEDHRHDDEKPVSQRSILTTEEERYHYTASTLVMDDDHLPDPNHDDGAVGNDVSQHDDHLDEDDKSNSQFQQFRDRCGVLVNSVPVQSFMTLLIITNSLLLGVLTFRSIKEHEEAGQILEYVDLGILVCFTIECIFHIIYLGPCRALQNGWILFDSIVVFFSWVFMGSSFVILRSFRIFRIFSLVSRWDSLRSLFLAIGQTIPKMASIWAALMIVFYIFCVLYTTLYQDLFDQGYLSEDYFGRLDKTFVTLFQIMTLDNWSEVAREVMKARGTSFIGFFFFIIFTSFFVINLVVAVICESLIALHRNQDEAAAEKLKEKTMGDADPPVSGKWAVAGVDGSSLHSQISQPSVTMDHHILQQLLKNQVELQMAVKTLTCEVQDMKERQETFMSSLDTTTTRRNPQHTQWKSSLQHSSCQLPETEIVDHGSNNIRAESEETLKSSGRSNLRAAHRDGLAAAHPISDVAER